MSGRPHPIHYLIGDDPAAARRQLLAEFVKANASMVVVASQMGCSRSTLYQWVRKLGMLRELREAERIARRDGWHHGRLGKWFLKQRASE